MTESQHMAQSKSVVTGGRFSEGLTWQEFLDQAVVNRDKFEMYYSNNALSEDDLAFFRRAVLAPGGPAKILAIAEDWCGDVYRELPTVARISEAAGMELRIFPRDKNPDIMDEFLSNNGKSRAIPVFVFYTKDMRYIAHFLERSSSAHAGLAAAMDEVKSQLNLPESTTFATVPEPQKQEFLREVLARIVPQFEQWRRDSIVEMRQLLSHALKISERAVA